MTMAIGLSTTLTQVWSENGTLHVAADHAYLCLNMVVITKVTAFWLLH